MGTPPRVTIQAATLAGGHNNQDRFAYGEGWAFVLDGASSFSSKSTTQDGGWYAEQLRRALCDRLPASKSDLSIIVSQAISEVATLFTGKTHDYPTSTIAMARWGDQVLEVFVLGDSYAMIMRKDGSTQLITDDRISKIRPDLRKQYRENLQKGKGFDENHRALLAEIQNSQSALRNRDEGYWIAGMEPRAAYKAYRQTERFEDVDACLLFTDGISDRALTPRALATNIDRPEKILSASHLEESLDPKGCSTPRSKIHDDKTLIAIINAVDKSVTTQH